MRKKQRCEGPGDQHGYDEPTGIHADRKAKHLEQRVGSSEHDAPPSTDGVRVRQSRISDRRKGLLCQLTALPTLMRPHRVSLSTFYARLRHETIRKAEEGGSSGMRAGQLNVRTSSTSPLLGRTSVTRTILPSRAKAEIRASSTRWELSLASAA